MNKVASEKREFQTEVIQPPKMDKGQSHSPRSIRTKSDTVESSAQLRLVFWMTLQITQLMHTMSELTFITVFAFASFLEWTTEFCFVTEKTRETK